MSMRNRRAFTLLELIVVVAIISALIGILVPALSSARNKSKMTACANCLRQVGLAMRGYLSDNGDVFPYASFMPSVGPFPVAGETPIYIADVLAPYSGGAQKIFQCPQDVDGSDRPAPNTGKTYFQSEKTSYDYRNRLGGINIKAAVDRRRQSEFAVHLGENAIWLLRDFDNFHNSAGNQGSRRYVYYDGHVSDFEE
jgi:prepilin-type N-terminal cleavage/methylation domain-containing protein